jgi:AraC family transcriptional regulator of adaptative response/methylated-DNA-[protein]-cysteine methyltransferase
MKRQAMAEERRWAQLARREKRPRPAFVYGVRTTGIYCRPGCSARLPKRQNAAFFATRAAAERAGFRPCLRCRPGPSVAARSRLAR